jgi:hypothetical protein
MAQKCPPVTQADVQMFGQIAKPSPPGRARVGECVTVRDAGEVVVERIGVAALAVVEAAGDGVVVVSSDRPHIVLNEYREYAVRMRAERADVAKTEQCFRTSSSRIFDYRPQRMMIGVDATKGGEAPVRDRLHAHRSRPIPLKLEQMAPFIQQV